MNGVEYFPGKTLAEIEREVILSAIKIYQGNKAVTAKSLDIAVRTLDKKLESYGYKSEAKRTKAD